MAPPKTFRDYISFDAYADSIFLKREGRTGMFGLATQESADAEIIINLLRRYSTQLEKERAPQALIDQIRSFAGTLYSVKAAEKPEHMKKALTSLKNFDLFLQSDVGSGVNHYSRLLRLAKEKGFELAQIGRGFRSITDSLELGLTLDQEDVRDGPETEPYKVSELLPAEEVVPAPEEQPLQPLRQRAVVNRTLEKPAKDWIKQFQTTNDIYELRRDQAGNPVPKTDWLLRLLAVRSLVNARPGDKSFYQRPLSLRDINTRAEALANDPDMKDFLESVRKKSAVYEATMQYARKGTGSGLDSWVKKYMAVNGLAPRGELMSRYLPSAELRVDGMKVLLKKRNAELPDKLDCVSQIIAARLTVDARRGGFTGMDERMKNAPASEDFIQCRDLAKRALEKLNPGQINRLLEVARDGHGGKMLERFSEMTQINAQNWRERANEPPQRQDSMESLRSL